MIKIILQFQSSFVNILLSQLRTQWKAVCSSSWLYGFRDSEAGVFKVNNKVKIFYSLIFLLGGYICTTQSTLLFQSS